MKAFLALAALLPFATACSITPHASTEAVEVSEAQAAADIRSWLEDFGTQYRYDVGYMEELLDLSPTAYDAFAGGMAMASLRVHLPVDAHYVGTISALLADDCGQCTQLTLRLAAEAGVDRAILQQLLERPEGLTSQLRMVNEYATQVVKGENVSAERVARLKEVYGEEAFAELAVNVLGVRIYPALRRALGAETACPAPSLDF